MDATARADRPGQARPASRALTRPARLDLDSFARATSTHPELVRRLAVLGLLGAEQDAAGRLWFRPAETATMARIQRLRAGFALNYARARPRPGPARPAGSRRRPRVSGPGVSPGQVAVTQRLARLLDTAEQETRRLKDEYVSVEHLIIALLAEGQQTAAGRLLASAG
jgi:Clp amino terminal domain, pathogenicity island component